MLSIAGALAGCQQPPEAKKSDAAVPVTLAQARQQDVPREVQAFGRVEASSTVEVLPQVQGLVTEVHFKEGEFVERGQLLFTVDTRPYSASLAAAQAELARNEALARQASLEAARAARLRAEGIASDQEVAKAQADAASSAASVKLGEAQIRSARLNVAFTRITAPIAGRTGSLLVHAGNLVRPSDPQPLTVIRSLKPVYVRFSVPQEYLETIRQKLGHDPLMVRARPRGGSSWVEGPLTFLENTVDEATGTLTLKATFLNDGQELWPGASVDVALVLGVDRGATVVPEAALSRTQDGAVVFVVDAQNKAQLRRVQLTRTTADLALIREGVAPGERVVTDGQLRLRQGTKVKSR